MISAIFILSFLNCFSIIMTPCCEISYNKKYSSSTIGCIISNMGDGKNAVYDPVAFGKWLSDVYGKSRFKSWQQVADEVDSSRATLSRYAGVKKQTLTDKPSQPKPDLVIRLAKTFEEDVDKVLKLAGHAPLTQDIEEESFDYLARNLPPERKRQIGAIIKTFVDAEFTNENSQKSKNITLDEVIVEDKND